MSWVLVGLAAGLAQGQAAARTVRSIAEIRNQEVVRQHFDLTCGAAAIATVMTWQLGRPVGERTVALAMLQRTSPNLVRARQGFSLLDLKVYAASQGLGAEGFAGLTLADLDRMAPVITPVREHGFRHFVVWRGRRGGRVLVADPAFGNRTLSEDAFVAAWAGRVGFRVFDPRAPEAPDRMGAPARLFLTPAGQAVREAAGRPPLARAG